MNDDFFEDQEEQSAIKTEIVTKYFVPWSSIMLGVPRVRRIGYVDFYCGPGRFDDGTESTPLLILKQIINTPKLRDSVVTVFNDKNESHVAKLKSEAQSLPGFETLSYSPEFSSNSVEGDYTAEFRD